MSELEIIEIRRTGADGSASKRRTYSHTMWGPTRNRPLAKTEQRTYAYRNQ
jgi:hypothetical protein